MKVYGVFLNENEDRRVMFAASSVICNLVNDFSPLRPVSGPPDPFSFEELSPSR
jgi:hypothetical protein